MTTRTVKLTYPDLITFVSDISAKAFDSSRFKAMRRRLSFTGGPSNLLNNLKRFPVKKYLPGSIIAVSFLAVVLLVIRQLSRPPTAPKAQPTGQDSRVTILGAKATTPLNREFSFPLKDRNGKTLTDLKFVLESAELRDEIIVKGKRATAVQGRTFLILNLKITSSFDRTLEINTQDYFRLTVNGLDTDFLAPDIHNDPVAIQPISTKFTRIGFPISDTDRNLNLLVGEITGEKTKVELNLK